MRLLKIYVLTFLSLLVGLEALAYENRCRNYAEGDTRSLCRNARLPGDQTRGRSASVLSCPGSVDSHQRHPEPVPRYDDWAKEIRIGGSRSEEAHAMRTSEPAIKWSGVIPFSVVESWNWISCDLMTSAYECGTHQECRNVQTSYQTCDKDRNCTTRSRTERVCDNVANTCYADVRRSSQQTCSIERIGYSAEFLRDPNWNPKNPKYSEFIPNKYDLLPGEVELIQISASGDGTITPGFDVGDAWNSYRPSFAGSAVGAACAQRSDLNLEVKIETAGRLIKPSPNAFRRPMRPDGSPMPIFRYQPTTDAQDEPINGRPTMLRLADTSANLVDLMAKQSRDNGKREELKDELGINGKPKELDAAKMSSFFKNTQLRLSLFEDKWYGNSSFSPPIYMGDGDAITSANYSLSEIQAIRNSEYWEIPLVDDNNPGNSLYQNTKWLSRMLGMDTKSLKPNQRYRLELSMFQKGVPFYFQLCSDENPEKDKCYKSEKDVFSKPIEVNFWTHPDYDERPWYVRLNDFTVVDWLHRKMRSRSDSDENYSTQPLVDVRGGRK